MSDSSLGWTLRHRLVPHLLFWSSLFLASAPPACLIAFAPSWRIKAYMLLPLLVLATGLPAGWRLRAQPGRLLRWLYGVQAPLYSVAFAYAFAVAQPQPPALLALALPCLAAGALAWRVWRPETLEGRAPARFAAASFAGLAAGYFAPFALLVLAGAAAVVLGIFTHDPELTSASWLFGLLLTAWILPIAVVSVAFCVGPVVVFARELVEAWRALEPGAARGRALLGLVLLASAYFGAMDLVDRQPRHGSVAAQYRDGLLAEMADGDKARQRFADDAEGIRAGLLDIYLASFRYLDDPERPIIRPGARLEDQWMAPFQWLCAQAAWPWLYRGADLRGDQRLAAARYVELFDVPIQEGEREAIEAAERADWSSEEKREREPVEVETQHLELREHDGWAEVEVVERLVNHAWNNQEVVYEFSLPAHAAITGVWLGPTHEDRRHFAALVAPRGAAAKVYQQEKRRNIDPALLEEVGRGAYRLRIFPVLPRGEDGEAGPPLYASFTFQLMGDGDAWAMPRLKTSRNVGWREADRRLSGRAWDWPETAWLPATLPRTPAPLRRQRYEATLADWRVTAEPLPAARPALGPRSVAVVVDTSYSMRTSTAALRETLARLRELSIEPLVFHAEANRAGRPAALDETPSYFGHLPVPELFAQFARWRGDRRFDVTLLLTDEGGSAPASLDAPSELPEPTWLVHLDGRWPAGHDPLLLERLERSGGGVAPGLDTVLDQWRWPTREGAEVVGDYLFTFEQRSGAAPSRGGFEALAAHQLIHHLARGVAPSELAGLDALHAIAVEHRVVSPLSSMLVLVEERQLEALARESLEDDRFAVVPPDDPSFQNPFGLSAVPEPEEWALFALGAALLLALRRRG